MTASQESIADLRAKLEQCEKTKNGYAKQLDALSTAITDVLVKRIEPRLSRHPVTVVQHAGSVIESIGRAMGSEYDDGDDLIECVRLLVRECAALRARCETLANNHEHRVEEMAALREQLAAKHSECPDCADYAARSGRFAEQADRLQRERDEALARCETLRELADAAASEQGLAQRRMINAQRERNEARASVADAYRRGAEAMREACANAVERSLLPHDHTAQSLRALPIPEEP